MNVFKLASELKHGYLHTIKRNKLIMYLTKIKFRFEKKAKA